MEPKFEIRYYDTRAMIAEFARKYSVGPRPVVVAITLPIVVICALFAMSPMGAPELRRMIAVFLCVYAVAFFMPQWYAWMALRNSKKQNDGVAPEMVVTFDDECIQVFQGMMHLTIEYRKIQKTVRLKHSYAVMNGKRTAVLIREDSFTRGSLSEFKSFLREKCPGIQIAE